MPRARSSGCTLHSAATIEIDAQKAVAMLITMMRDETDLAGCRAGMQTCSMVHHAFPRIDVWAEVMARDAGRLLGLKDILRRYAL